VYGDDAGADAAGELDREVGGEDAGDLARSVVGVDQRDGAVLALHPRARARVDQPLAQALAVDDHAGDAVGVNAAAVGVDERHGDGLGRGRLEPRALEQGLRPALELGGRDQ
jgi:hypothetical protein